LFTAENSRIKIRPYILPAIEMLNEYFYNFMDVPSLSPHKKFIPMPAVGQVENSRDRYAFEEVPFENSRIKIQPQRSKNIKTKDLTPCSP
jgi:hypothetical protein